MSQTSYLNSPGNPVAATTRRSTRIERSVPLIVMGQNQMGQPFMERTASVTLSKHGCRYPSRHDYGVGTAVTLQLVGSIGNEKPQTVRAIVRSIHPPASLRELQQVGVELETPSNVWGIVPAPTDWTSATETNLSTPQLAVAVAHAPEPETKKIRPGEVLRMPEPNMSEVASLKSPSPAVSRPAPPSSGTSQVQRAVVTPDKLISALQGKLQQEAEKAVQAAFAKQVNDRIQDALRSIHDARKSSVHEVEELAPKQIEKMKLSLKESIAELTAQRNAEIEAYRERTEEMAQALEKQAGQLRRELANAAEEYTEKMTQEIGGKIPARLTEAVCQATSDFESATAVVVDQRYEELRDHAQVATEEALLKLNGCSAKLQEASQSVVNSGLEEFRREMERHVNVALAETRERAVSALSLLDAESLATCNARRQALEAEVSRSAERATEEFRKGMQAFLHSCLAAAMGAVDEQSRATLNQLLKVNGKILEGPGEKPATSVEGEMVPEAGNGLPAH